MARRPAGSRKWGLRVRIAAVWKRRWVRVAAVLLTIPLVILGAALTYSYITIARVIDARLHGERERVLPRVFARPLELRVGQSLSGDQLVDRLNELGYAEREMPAKPGEFAVTREAITIVGRAEALQGKTITVSFVRPTPASRQRPGRKPPPPPKPTDRVEFLQLGGGRQERIVLDAPILTALISGEREKRRPVALSAIPDRVTQAVLAIEDRRFYDHPGVDIIRSVGAIVTNLRGDTPYLVGGSTITQQLVKNFFLTSEKSYKRKLMEQFMALALERRASKDEILELYLNDIPLGQRGSFSIRGVAEASRLFFGKDVSNVSLAEAATIAGVIQRPSALNPFNNPDECRERRNVVLQAMATAEYISQESADQAIKEPLVIVQRALESEAPYFVDYVGQQLAERYPGLTTTTDEAVDVYTTLDLHYQRLALDAVRDGLANVDKLLARRKLKERAEAALVAVDPRTGDILAMVGGRFYNRSQFNRAVTSRRQPGSVFKPFVFLAAFERAQETETTDMSPASIVDDSPSIWETNEGPWEPANYEDEYDGPITWRRALARSRNLATIKVAEQVGFDHVSALWRRMGLGTPPRTYPSIALGVFEATPLEIATAYTVFPNQGTLRPLRSLWQITRAGKALGLKPPAPRPVVRPTSAYLVTSMMRSVLNEGTGAGARGLGFTLDAAGKTGTTNDLRDAWFVGFTPELLTAVWVGFDDNQPLGLSGARAALPIWAQFMRRALAGHTSQGFHVPDGIAFVDIDPETGKLASTDCPRVIAEAFLEGTEPTETCDLHRRSATSPAWLTDGLGR
ncbi:MAG: PBP1A family penicillin-binding protein [Acidimicrobiia bacterium]|nr:PBP1A family penicillin-binding protein [Acidimicrobiia bacterium]